jgi:AGZA family xanthine/uracil permease-like MFS transporter
MANTDSFLERVFHLKENNTNVRTEILAGITTFMTMAYILIVNSGMLSNTGMSAQAVMIATAVSSAIATLLMAFLANYPFALAPGMGLNAFFTFTVCFGMGVEWPVALGMVFISGILFLLITVSGIRKAIVSAIPNSLKSAIAAGIGLFIAFIGLQGAGIIVNNDSTLVSLGNLGEPATLLALIGLVITAGLMALRVKGAILIGILATGIIGIPMGVVPKPTGIVGLPTFDTWAPVLFKLDIAGAFKLSFAATIFAFLFVDMFDTMGTLIGVAKQADFLDKDGNLPKTQQAMLADAIGTVVGAVAGTSTVTTYVESASGVAQGGRTGLTSFTVAILFLLSMFFYPLITSVAGISSITAPALIIVGALMIKSIVGVAWDDMTDAIPAFIAVIAMPMTYSISHGIALSFIIYPILKFLGGKGKEVSIIMWILAVLFLLRYIFIPV